MKPKQKIMQLLCVHRRPWMQKELAERAGCTPVYVSKIMKGFLEEGILSRQYKNRVNLVGASKLLMKWGAIREMPEAIYVKSEMSAEEIEKKLSKNRGYALTLFSGAWHRTKFMKTERIEAYIGEKFKISKIGEETKEPSKIALYRETGEMEGAEEIDGLRIVHPVQNYVDLVSVPGGMRAANEIAKRYGWY